MVDGHTALDLTATWFGYLALAIFVIAYILVIAEDAIELRKSKPVLVAAGLIWALIGLAYTAAGMPDAAKSAAEHTINEYGELFLFLLVAITYVNTLEERRVFEVLRARLTGRGLNYRQLFWLTGVFAFFLSGVLDNLTTAWVPLCWRSAPIRAHLLCSPASALWSPPMPAAPSRPLVTSPHSWSGRRARSDSLNSLPCSCHHS
jgi:Citrate transporter